MADPNPIDINDSVKARFWAKVDVRGPDDCWTWIASKDKQGYGYFGFERKSWRAPRISLMIAGSSAPSSDAFACHTCDNPSCVNPRHLWWGSNSQNIRDAKEKGRHFYASRTHCKRGHPFNDDNTRIKPQSGGRGYARKCVECIRLLDRERYQKNTEKFRERSRQNHAKARTPDKPALTPARYR